MVLSNAWARKRSSIIGPKRGATHPVEAEGCRIGRRDHGRNGEEVIVVAFSSSQFLIFDSKIEYCLYGDDVSRD